MGATVIKMEGNHTTSIKNLAGILKSRLNAELVSESCQEFDKAAVILLCFEKYYFRNGSYASLTVMLTEYESKQTADIIGFGGGAGILNISYGANSNFTNIAKNLLVEHGFQ